MHNELGSMWEEITQKKDTPCTYHMDLLRVDFFLDGTGLYYNPIEPLALDAIICFGVASAMGLLRDYRRDEVVPDLPLPLATWTIGDAWGYNASMLFPEGEPVETYIMRRRRFRLQFAERIASGVPKTTGGVYKNNNQFIPLLLCSKLSGWCEGDMKEVQAALSHITHLGKMRGAGRGRIRSINVTKTPDNFCLMKNGCAMRHLPKSGGSRMVRMRPPYWSVIEQVPACEVGENIL